MKWEDQRYRKHWIPGRGIVNQKMCKQEGEKEGDKKGGKQGGKEGEKGEKKGDKCVNNLKRKQQCPSNYVLWTEENQFWLPGLNVEDALDLVMSSTIIEQR